MMEIKCVSCKKTVSEYQKPGVCDHCGGYYCIEYNYDDISMCSDLPGIWRYKDLLPVINEDNITSLGEGNTPLIRSSHLFGGNVFFKDETRNPTGSMKDRSLSVSMSKIKELGFKRTIISSTGSAGISAAAYAAKAGITNTILVPAGTPKERLIAMHLYGSVIIEIDAPIEELSAATREIAKKPGWANVSTNRKSNHYQSEAPKTIAYEIFRQLGKAPDMVLVPVGGASTMNGIWKGFRELNKMGKIKDNELPRMIAVHHKNYNSLELAIRNKVSTEAGLLDIAQSMDKSLPCIAKNIQHTYCTDGILAVDTLIESQGDAVSVTDEEIIDAQRLLANNEGIFAEPTSAAVVAAMIKYFPDFSSNNRTAVLLITGSGYRETALTLKANRFETIKADIKNCFEYISY